MKPQVLAATADYAALRRELRARRRAITGPERLRAGRQVARLIDQARWLRPGRRIGLYLSMSEELDTTALLQLARRRGCVIAVPRVISKRHSRMHFFLLGEQVARGAYGISEPSSRLRISVRELDIVFMPLVGFDASGHRIGMGKGFYDRALSHRRHLRRWRRPLLAGIAYNAQEVADLAASRHDVPADLIVTESTLHRIGRQAPR